jgi:hypothetical protein
MRQPDAPPRDAAAPATCHLFVRSFGPDETLAHQLADQLAAWDTAGRPSTDRLRIRAYPPETEYAPSANETVVRKQRTQLVLDWQQ